MPGARENGKPLVFATVGTDHHRFDRLVHWLDRWLEAGGSGKARCLIQTGTSTPSRHAESRDYLEYDAMQAAIRDAAVIVSHGGPGTIALAACAGKPPIVVPRLHELSEHVDDHQVVFSRRMAGEGAIALAESEDRFRELIDEAIEQRGVPRGERTSSSVADVVRRFEEVVDDLTRSRPGGKRATAHR